MSTPQSSMNISLPEGMKDWVEEQASSEGYQTVSEYFRNLVRQDQQRKAREVLDRKLIEALDSGEAVEMTAKDWDHVRTTVRQRISSKRSKK